MSFVVLVRMHLNMGYIIFQPLHKPFQKSNPFRQRLRHALLQPITVVVIGCFEQRKPSDLNIEVHLLFYLWIPRTERLYLRVLQHGLVHILTAPQRASACHNLRYKLLLVFDRLIKISVKRLFRHVPVYIDVAIAVALADYPASALFQVCRTPRAIQVVRRHKPVLYVSAGSHLLRASHKDADTAFANFCEQRCFLRLCVSVVDEGYLIFRHSGIHQLLFYVVIKIEAFPRR